MNTSLSRVALITGSAQRIGAAIASHLHQQGWTVVVHYHQSEQAAQALVEQLNQLRANSAYLYEHDLRLVEQAPQVISEVIALTGRLDLLVNNASSFYPTKVGEVTPDDWDNLFATNCKGAFFLCQAARSHLAASAGSIINITDIHAHTPLRGYCVYSMAKAALAMLTKSLAKEFAPEVRVNAVAPGAIAWPENENAMDDIMKQKIIDQVPLKRAGDPLDIAHAVEFLATRADYVTGQMIRISGGRT